MSDKEKPTDELAEKFKNIFNKNLWKSSESVSGAGSELIYTENLRKELPELFLKYGIKSLLDAPCGDFNWMRSVIDATDIKYIGVDIVPELIRLNSIRYQSDRIEFKTLDITKDDLPEADLIICRDCLFHLSFLNIKRFIRNFLRSNIRYILTTSHGSDVVSENKEIDDGGFRLIDLYAPPFCFPEDCLEEIDDWISGYPKRKMIMWRKEQLALSLVAGFEKY